MNIKAFGECVLLHQQIISTFYPVQALTKDMASSILKVLATNDGIDRYKWHCFFTKGKSAPATEAATLLLTG